jgi:hypothetical protein
MPVIKTPQLSPDCWYWFLKKLVIECRTTMQICSEMKLEAKWENEDGKWDIPLISEIPKSSSFSGWMRNQREASELSKIGFI